MTKLNLIILFLTLLLFLKSTLHGRLSSSPLTPSHLATNSKNIETLGDVEHRAKIRAICLNISRVNSFDMSFCLAKAALPLLLPYAAFSCLLQLYVFSTSNGMAYSIRYALSWQHDGGCFLPFCISLVPPPLQLESSSPESITAPPVTSPSTAPCFLFLLF